MTANDCDLISESVFENIDLKIQIFLKLDRVAKQGVILASNTSVFDIDEIAAITKRPKDVIGPHFFSPAYEMKLHEIVRVAETADDVAATAMQLAQAINKIAVLVGVSAGFRGNRVFFPPRDKVRSLFKNALCCGALMRQ